MNITISSLQIVDYIYFGFDCNFDTKIPFYDVTVEGLTSALLALGGAGELGCR